jgi:hypothetical protein
VIASTARERHDSHSSQVRCDFWHERHALATFLRATFVLGPAPALEAVFLGAGARGEPLDEEADADALADASDVSLAVRVQFACRS